MATSKQPTDSSGVILEKILEVKKLVDQSLELSRETAGSLRNLRTELGVDGAHGRLPQLEEQCARLDRRQEVDHKEVCRLITEASAMAHDDKNKIIALIAVGDEKLAVGDEKLAIRLDKLEDGQHEMTGGKKVLIFIGGFLGGSMGAAAIGIVAKMLGLIH